MPSNTNQTQADPAASWVRRTPRQQRQAAARFDREAREAIAAHNARRAAETQEKLLRADLRRIELLGEVLLTGTVRARDGVRRPVSKPELSTCRDAVRGAWSFLKRNPAASAVLTVLA